MRTRSLGLALLLAAGTIGPLLAEHAAAADTPTVTITVGCNAVTFAYTGFPNATNTIDSEQVYVEPSGPNVFGPSPFTFTGPTGTDTVPIAGLVSEGDTINAAASWSDPAPGDEVAVIQTVPGCGGSCPQGTKANFRWHYSANGTSGSWSGTRGAPCPSPLTMGPQAMEGDLKVSPGTVLKAGYDLTVPGNNQALSITVANPQVVFTARCVSGAAPTSPTITLAMPTQNYSIADSAWYPSGDQHSPLVYQGSVTVPDLCGGGAVRLDHGGTFSASVS
jgi:hypothetical protein